MAAGGSGAIRIDMADIVERLRELGERFEWPFDGEPGSNPDYFDSEDQATIAAASAEIERLREKEASYERSLAVAQIEIEGLRAENERLLVIIELQKGGEERGWAPWTSDKD
jgi:FtsZ-binding cell division protein ZapB